MTSQRIKQMESELIAYLDMNFPKDEYLPMSKIKTPESKMRGKAMVLIALAKELGVKGAWEEAKQRYSHNSKKENHSQDITREGLKKSDSDVSDVPSQLDGSINSQIMNNTLSQRDHSQLPEVTGLHGKSEMHEQREISKPEAKTPADISDYESELRRGALLREAEGKRLANSNNTQITKKPKASKGLCSMCGLIKDLVQSNPDNEGWCEQYDTCEECADNTKKLKEPKISEETEEYIEYEIPEGKEEEYNLPLELTRIGNGHSTKTGECFEYVRFWKESDNTKKVKGCGRWFFLTEDNPYDKWICGKNGQFCEGCATKTQKVNEK